MLQREADRDTRFELGREVAALIPGATLIPLPGSSHLFYHGDWPAVLEAMLGFLCEPVNTGPRLTNRENIRRKLEVRSRAQIAAWVPEHRLGRGAPR